MKFTGLSGRFVSGLLRQTRQRRGLSSLRGALAPRQSRYEVHGVEVVIRTLRFRIASSCAWLCPTLSSQRRGLSSLRGVLAPRQSRYEVHGVIRTLRFWIASSNAYFARVLLAKTGGEGIQQNRVNKPFTPFLSLYFAASTMTAKSAGFNAAPPIRPPSTSGWASSPAAFLAFIEPPYWTVIASPYCLP